MSEPPQIVSTDELDWQDQERDPDFKCRRKAIARAAGNRHLGCSLYEVPPGCRAWPYHYHCGNEEAIFVLSGTGRLRCGTSERAIAPGDYVAFVPGEAGAHQIWATGDVPLRYLCFSTANEPDIVVYPDSQKVGIFAGSAPGGDKEQRTIAGFFPLDASVDYWQGEASESPG